MALFPSAQKPAIKEFVNNYLYFDHASTTPCGDQVLEVLRRFSSDDYGNPSSNHGVGQRSAKAIRDARAYFASLCRITPEQVLFTGSGTEADNLAILGVSLASKKPFRVLISATEHSAVKKSAESLKDFGFEVETIPVDSEGQIQREAFLKLLEPPTRLISIQQVNQITGAVLPVEELAAFAKKQNPDLIFHTDAVQAFGKTALPQTPSCVDLVSISAHKIGGPKGVGALLVLHPLLQKKGQLRPLIWGGGQEGGFRSGTQNPGLIAGFHLAAVDALKNQQLRFKSVSLLREKLNEMLVGKGLNFHWNSPSGGVPHILSFSLPGIPAGPFAKLLEEKLCIVSVGSACNSLKPEPDPVLRALGLSLEIQTSALRISLSHTNTVSELEILVDAIEVSVQRIQNLIGRSIHQKKRSGRRL